MSSSPTTDRPTPLDLAPQLRLAIVRLSRRLRQEQADPGLSPSMASALSSLERLGPMNLGELAAVEQVAPPTLTRVVSRLEEAGLVTRTIDADDRRIARVEASEAGRRLLLRIRTRKTAFLARRLSRLGEDDRTTLAAALPILERLLEGDAK